MERPRQRFGGVVPKNLPPTASPAERERPKGAYTTRIRRTGVSDKHHFSYDAVQCAALRAALSDERFATYLDVCNNDERDALRLYTWNTAVAAAFYGPLQACEVALRNAVDDALGFRYGHTWFDNSTIMRGAELRMARDARDRIQRAGKTATPGRVIAELGFGYWVGLFARSYDQTLWRSAFYEKFHPRPKRHDLFERLDRLRTLRNRVAHHEPIFQRNLRDDYERITDVLEQLSPKVRGWVDRHSRVYEVLAQDHGETERF
jgi:hypothetical protein